MNTLDDLMGFLLNQLRVSQREATAVMEVDTKTIALKYEAELYKVFSEQDIIKANELDEKAATAYLHDRYEQATGEKSEKLLDQITDVVVSEILKKPRDYFNFASN